MAGVLAVSARDVGGAVPALADQKVKETAGRAWRRFLAFFLGEWRKLINDTDRHATQSSRRPKSPPRRFLRDSSEQGFFRILPNTY